MTVEIQFIDGLKELTIPSIKLTKSKNGKTGTATFIFIKPTIFNVFEQENFKILEMSLVWDNKKIITNEISIFFKEGKPFLLKVIFFFKNSFDWFCFLNFMTLYSKESGLLFSFSSN